MVADDLRWAYAAYRMGAMPELPQGLSGPKFDLQFYEAAKAVNEVYILVAPVKGERRPVGLIFANITVHPEGRDTVEPHLLWFSWATARNKLETSVKWLAEMRRENLVLIMAPMRYHAFFVHLCRHGVLRMIGKIHTLFDGEDGMAYQSTVPK